METLVAESTHTLKQTKMNVIGESPEGTIKSKYETFCDLCCRRINKDEEVRAEHGKQTFLLHLDCNDPEVKARVHKIDWSRNLKKRSVKTGGKRNTRKSNQYRKNWY